MMLKPILIFGVFAAGVAVGVIAMRNFDRPSVATAPQVMPGVASSAAVSTPPVEAPDTRPPATPLAAVSIPTASAANSVTSALPQPASIAAQAPASDSVVVVQPIDAGPVFNKMIARASEPGNENQLGDAHRALERETRDEGWAYTMEAELQNSMGNEMSMSGFKAEHIECRATLCEVRLSGNGPQQGASIKRWNESFIGQASPLGQRLFLNYAGSVSNNDRTDTLLIFRKPPPGSAPQQAPQQVSQRRLLTD